MSAKGSRQATGDHLADRNIRMDEVGPADHSEVERSLKPEDGDIAASGAEIGDRMEPRPKLSLQQFPASVRHPVIGGATLLDLKCAYDQPNAVKADRGVAALRSERNTQQGKGSLVRFRHLETAAGCPILEDRARHGS